MILSTLRRMPFQHVTSIVFLILTAVLLSGGLGDVVRGARASAFIPVGVVAALFGWWMGNRRFNGWLAWVAMILLGAAFLWVTTAQLLGPFWQLILSLPDFAYQSFVWFWDPQATGLDFSASANAWSAIVAQSSGLWLRVMQLIPNIQNGSTRYDPVVYILVWSMVLWLVISWEAWFICRGSVLTGAIPSLLLLGEVLYLTTVEFSPLWVLLCITLLLMGLTHFRLTFASWMQRKVDYAEIILDTTISIIFTVTLGLAAIAGAVPSVSIQQIVDTIRNNSVPAKPGSKTLNDTLGLKAAPGQRRNSIGRYSSESIRHVIGPGPELSRDLVMVISTGEMPPGQAFSPSLVAPYHRWRSYTLDRYTSTGWANTPVEGFLYESDVQVFKPIPEKYRVLRQSVRFELDMGGNLYWDGILQSVNQPFEVSWRVKPETNPPVNADLLGKADMLGAFSDEEYYQATSFIPMIDAKKLRESSGAYPDEIRSHYLLLPESVPDRVLALAREITATAPTPYEEAQAIERYLRKTYPYTLDISAPPSHRDVVDYFLFDLKKGYCDYYATAMVVLARAVGLPSRIIFGYAGGNYDFNTAEYSIVRADAHAWVEVYFPQVGWVEFDPTANQPDIERLEGEEPTIAAPTFERNGFDRWVELQRTSPTTITLWSAIGLVGLMVGILLLQMGEVWLLNSMQPIRAIQTVYRGLYFFGRRVAGAGVAGETADEFATLLHRQFERLLQKAWLNKLLSPAAKELDLLSNLYLRAMYTQRPPEKREMRGALRAWQALRWRLLLAGMLSPFFHHPDVVDLQSKIANLKSKIQNRFTRRPTR